MRTTSSDRTRAEVQHVAEAEARIKTLGIQPVSDATKRTIAAAVRLALATPTLRAEVN